MLIKQVIAATGDVVGTFSPPGKIPQYQTDTVGFVSAFIKVFVIVAGIYTLWQLLLGGFGYISASGDKTKTEQASKRITMAIIGIIVIASSFLLIAIISFILFGKADAILNPQLEVIK